VKILSGKIFGFLNPPHAISFLVLLIAVLMLSGCISIAHDGGLLPSLWVEI